ncbi:hypothetical protein SAMN05421823_102502 [Catalinimonas alkaloidigena]|uniref:Uncharacterized protein n=1 Tax=Catalinimonas alkaloidigena TaxID=1075417 RepID=A0A1G9B3L6_9BACT|nr:hypothetical protein [Catalinimonas alkaloidigena]SDK34141.1 hypothetical protein SAMN05421823_102502 [Catalinimonas alkaloidigena]
MIIPELSRNPITQEVTVSPLAYVRFELYLETSYGLGDYQLLITANLPTDHNGYVQWRFQDYLNDALEADATAPDPDQDTLAYPVTQLRRFYVRWVQTQAYQEPTGNWTQEAERVVILGGVPDEYWPHLDRAELFRNWLTWQPDRRGLAYADRLWLDFCSTRAGVSSITWHVALYAYPNDVLPADQLESTLNVQAGPYAEGPQLVRFLLDFRTIAPVYRMVRFWLTDHNGLELAPVREYYLDPTTLERPKEGRHLLSFRNSLGGWDTLLTKGRYQHQLKTSRNVAELHNENGSSASYPLLNVWRRPTGQLLREVGTGWLTRPELEHLQEFELTREIIEWQENGQDLIPIPVISQSQELLYDQNHPGLVAAVFKYLVARTQHSFLPKAARRGNTRP